jgi:hypothetical protein
LELEAPQQLVCEVIQSQEQTHSQAEGVQLVEIPSNEPQQLVTIEIPFHKIPSE